MFYSVAMPSWTPDRPLSHSVAPAGLLPTRDAARRIALGWPIVAVAVRYDATRGVVSPQGPAARRRVGSWEAPAILDEQGGLTILGSIPADLVRIVGPAELRVHPGHADICGRRIPAPHLRCSGVRFLGPGRFSSRLFREEL